MAGAALAIRLPRLGARPMHCDEANQAFRAAVLWETGQYRYDPHEHHGPTLYWLTLPALWLSQAHDFSQTTEAMFRLVPVVFGAGLVLLVFGLAHGLGRPAALVAALLTAISPAMVYYSRYYIQETLLVFFTLGAILCAWRLVCRKGTGWAVGAGVCFGLMHATKETWVLAAAAMAIGLGLAWAWTRWRDGATAAAWPPARLLPLAAACGAACLAAGAFYSGFGADWEGPVDSIRAFATYVSRGTQGGLHAHPWYYYLELLVAYRPSRGWFWSEGLIVGLAGAGGVAALAGVPRVVWQGRANLALGRFLLFYTLALTCIYAAISYKTPWCMLSFLHGMILLAGLGAWALLRGVPTVAGKAVVGLALAGGVAHLGWQCYALSFRFPADVRNPYVYAHTSADVLNLAAQMERLAAVSPEGRDMIVHVVTPENYWPLPWYLRRLNRQRVGYWQDAVQWAKDTQGTREQAPPSVVILTADVQPVIDAHLRTEFNRQMIYGLRPGVLLHVYVRADLWDAFIERASRSSGA